MIKMNGDINVLLLLLTLFISGLFLPASGKSCTKQDWEPCKQAGYTFYYELGIGNCLRLIQKKKNYYSNSCSQNASLIEIRTQKVQDFYEAVFQYKDFKGPSWIWLDLLFSLKVGYYWRRQKKIAKLSFAHWETGSPRNSDKRWCPAISTRNYSWETHPCGDALHVVCETAASKSTDLLSRGILKLKRLRSRDTLEPADVLQAECSSLAPPNYILAWFRFGDNSSKRLTSNDAHFKPFEKFTLNRKKQCQRLLAVTIKVPVDRTWSDTNAVACELRHQNDVSAPTCETNPLCRRLNIKVKVPPPLGKPHLEIVYHHNGNKVFRGRYIIAKCSSCPKAHNYKFEVEQNLLDGSSKTDSADLNDPRVSLYGFTRRHVKTETRCERIEVLALELKADEMLKSLVIRCTAWNEANHVIIDSARSQDQTALAITPPTRPELYVKYHEPPNIVYNDQNLSATCSACMGDEGEIFWAVEDKYGSLPDAELNLFILSENLIEKPSVTRECVTWIQSSIVLQTWVLLHNKRLACYSIKKDGDLGGPTFVAYSLSFFVKIVDNEPFERAEVESIMVFISTILFFLILFILCCSLLQAKRSNKRKKKGVKGQARLARKRPQKQAVTRKASPHAKRRRLGVKDARSTCVDTGKPSSATGRRRGRLPGRGQNVLRRGFRPLQRWFGMRKQKERARGELPRRKIPTRPSPSNERTQKQSRGDTHSSQKKSLTQHHISTIQEETQSPSVTELSSSENLDPTPPMGKEGHLLEKRLTLVAPAEKDEKKRRRSSIADASFFQRASINLRHSVANRSSIFGKTRSQVSNKPMGV